MVISLKINGQRDSLCSTVLHSLSRSAKIEFFYSFSVLIVFSVNYSIVYDWVGLIVVICNIIHLKTSEITKIHE